MQAASIISVGKVMNEFQKVVGGHQNERALVVCEVNADNDVTTHLVDLARRSNQDVQEYHGF
jgi:hypothetical protein